MVRRARDRQRARRFNRRNPGFFSKSVSFIDLIYAHAQHMAREATWEIICDEERRLIHGTGTGEPLGIINEFTHTYRHSEGK